MGVVSKFEAGTTKSDIICILEECIPGCNTMGVIRLIGKTEPFMNRFGSN